MKSITFPSSNLANTAGLVAVGAATGAVAGVGALLTYSFLAGKGAGVLVAAKSALGLGPAAAANAAGVTGAAANAANAAGVTGAAANAANAVSGAANLVSNAAMNAAGATAASSTAASAGAGASNLSRLMNLLLPATAGMAGGGASGLGIARKIAHDQLERAKEMITEQAEHLQEGMNKMIAEQADALQERLQVLETRLEEPAPAENQLEQIKGIGPKLSALLNDAGIRTLDDLVKANPEKVQAILDNSPVKQLFKLEDWIAQAQELLAQKKNA